MKIVIFCSDNKNTRKAKKSFRLKKKQKQKQKQKNKFKSYKKKDSVNKNDTNSLKLDENILKFFNLNSKNIWKNNSKVIQLTKDFNLFDNSDKVFGTLLNLIQNARKNHEFLILNYKEGNNLVGALYFIDTFCWEIAKSKCWSLKLNNLPSIETEILTNLKSFKTNTSENKYTYIVNNKIKINRSDDKLARQEHIVKSKEIRDLIERGLRDSQKDNSLELTYPQHTAIDSAISEHFDNILLHAPTAQYGHLCGIFDKINKIATIMIYNFGKTISETLNDNKLPDYVEKFKDEIISNHTKQKFFSIKNEFNRENALTLLAIQEGISSVLSDDISRGHGLIDFIEHCFELSSDSQITLISGQTVIKIDNKYRISQMKVLGRDRRILAFNKENDIFMKPDKDYVKNAKYIFPGVIIETRIPLNI
ncbi:MAG: hypothetical protein WCK02_08820 [Bacteroidota bacterium]